MHITNGSVSRTYKPADYEGRTVTYSFTLEPADDADAETAKVAFLAEKHARHMPTEAQTEETEPAAPRMGSSLVKRAPRAVPPTISTAPKPTPPAETGATTSDPFAGGAPVQNAPVSVPASATVSNKVPPTPVVEITDAELRSTIRDIVARDPKYTQPIMDLIFEFTGDRVAPIQTVTDQAKRAEFLVKLAAL